LRISRTEPGLIVSAAAHATLLAAILVAFNSPNRFQDVQESIPVEMITDKAFSQISKGEKSAKEVRPVQKADKVADVHEQRPTPPLAEAKKDTPLPPPPLKRMPDPGEDEDKKAEPQKTAALPPPRPAVEQSKPAPEPPQRPQPAKAEPKEEPKPEPEKAETIAPKPPTRPKVETRHEAKPEPKPETKTEARSEPKPAPKLVEKPRLQTDEVAKLLARTKTDDKPVSKPKSGDDGEQKSRLDLTAISKLIDKDKPQARGSTGPEVVRTASLGTAAGTAPRMSPNVMDALNGLIMEQYVRCWRYIGTGAVHKYVPQVKVRFRPDGSLAAEPVLLNPTSDPAFASLASAALGAVRTCNPLKIPAQFAPFYDQWKSRTIAFDPEEMR
jgi:hypothetical protein